MLNIVFIDTNMRNEDGTYYIDNTIAKGKRLQIGERVVAYQDDEEWDAQILCNGNNWGVKILSEARMISNDRKVGHEEGFWEGYYCQLRIFFKILEEVGIKKEIIREVFNRFYGD